MSLNEQARPSGDNGTFLYWLAGLTAAVGLAFAAWPALDSMNPSAETGVPLVWVNMTKIQPDQRKTVYWKGYPIYIVRRTAEQIEAVRTDDDAEMPTPEKDSNRVLREDWIVVVGIGNYCVLKGQESHEPRGDWGGWFDVCQGGQYDLSGRIRTSWQTSWGTENLEIPPYNFVGDNWLVIGEQP